MKYNYTLANKIRTNLLLFTDREIRTKTFNINKIQKYYNNSLQIKNEEFVYSNIQENENNNHLKLSKINISNDTFIETPFIEKHCSQFVEKSLSKFLLRKHSKPIRLFSESVNIALGKKSHKRKSEQKLPFTLQHFKVGNTKKSGKIYLKNLCNSFISKTNLRKNVISPKKIHLIQKKRTTKSIKKYRKSNKMSEKNYNENILRKSPSGLNSIKLIIFGY